MKRILIPLVLLAVIGAAVYVVFNKKEVEAPAPVVPVEQIDPVMSVIGASVEGRPIENYTFGKGETSIMFVGGIHGGYEWNSVLLAYEFIDYLKANPAFIPAHLKISVVPSANPDGLFKVIGKEGRFALADVPTTVLSSGTGRFNANNVDLNRNFDCKWQATSTWRNKPVSAGTAAFSEPEAKAIRDHVLKIQPKAAVFWHSQSNAVYASECHNGVLPATLAVMNAYAKPAAYPAVASFDAYPISGDAEGWLASINIPAITVELKTHESIEWERNLAGIKGLLEYFKQ